MANDNEMEYRRLGRTGLKVSVLSFGSWVTFGAQLDTGLARDCLAAAYEAGVNFFDNAEAYAGGESERIMGEAIAELGWPRAVVRDLDQGLLGPPRRPEHAEHAQPQVPDAGDRRLARAARPRLRRPAVLPPRRSRTRRSRRRCGRCRDIVVAGKALYWGTSEWTRRRDPRRVGHRRAPPPAQAGDGAAAVQPVRARAGRAASTRGSTTTSASGSRRGARSRRACSPASTSTASPTAAAARCPGYEWLQDTLTDPERNEQGARAAGRSPTSSAARSRSSRIAWCAKNPHVSTVITGASRVEQVHENMGALGCSPR